MRIVPLPRSKRNSSVQLTSIRLTDKLTPKYSVTVFLLKGKFVERFRHFSSLIVHTAMYCKSETDRQTEIRTFSRCVIHDTFTLMVSYGRNVSLFFFTGGVQMTRAAVMYVEREKV